VPKSADSTNDEPKGTRKVVARAFTWVEDIVYVGLGVLLSVSALVLLIASTVSFSTDLVHGALPTAIVGLLDRLLLTLMIVELLYTVQVSFREHALVPEPFLIVGLVAAVRRILVVTAELTGVEGRTDDAFRVSMIELGVLAAMILVLVLSLVMLRSRHPDAVASRT
jgi:uncharacterized membrane protein (DUF373 family)